MSVKATQAVTGTVIATATDRASAKDRVLPTVMELAATIRTALSEP